MEMDERISQIDTLKFIGAECQKIISRHDDLLFKIKALTATLWSAATGWSISEDDPMLLLVGLAAVLGLWFVAATFRGAQKRYIERSDAMLKFLTDTSRLTDYMNTGALPPDVPTHLGGYEPRVERGRLLLKGLVSPTVAVFYGFFVLISSILFLAR